MFKKYFFEAMDEWIYHFVLHVRKQRPEEVWLLSEDAETRSQVSWPPSRPALSVFLCARSVSELARFGVLSNPLISQTDNTGLERGGTRSGHKRRHWQSQAQNPDSDSQAGALRKASNGENKVGLGLLPRPCRRSQSPAALRVPCLFLA